MPSGQWREHAQYVTSLKIYFRPRLKAVASRIKVPNPPGGDATKISAKVTPTCAPWSKGILNRAAVNEIAFPIRPALGKTL